MWLGPFRFPQEVGERQERETEIKLMPYGKYGIWYGSALRKPSEYFERPDDLYGCFLHELLKPPVRSPGQQERVRIDAVVGAGPSWTGMGIGGPRACREQL